MKKLLVIFSAIIVAGKLLAQNVGIGQPSPQQKLDVNGAVKIGNTSTNQPGTIRYSGGVFEGGDGSSWKKLDGLPSGAVVISETRSNSTLEGYGYTLLGYTDTGFAFLKTNIPTVPGHSWLPTTLLNSYVPTTSGGFLCWTGNEMLLIANPSDSRKYDPVADTWAPISTTGAPSGFDYAVWTGTEVITCNTTSGTGARYSPVSNTWTAISSTGAPSTRRINASVVWTGTEMIIWGGYTNPGGVYQNTGFRYNLATNTWTTTSNSSAPAARSSHTAVWAGNRMIIWGGINGSGLLQSGMKYNPTTDNWTVATSLVNAPDARSAHTAVWTGTEMIIYGGVDAPGGKYNSGTDTWTIMPFLSHYHTFGYSVIWTGSSMYVWGGYLDGNIGNDLHSYSPGSNLWGITPATDPPEARKYHGAVWADGLDMMIIWGGENQAGDDLYNGGRYYRVTSYNQVGDKKGQLYLFRKN